MKRSPLRRHTPLGRGGSVLRRTELAARSSTNSRPPKQPVVIHPDARARALSRSGGLCIVCVYNAGLDVDRAPDRVLRDFVERGVVKAARTLHHVLPKQRWPHLAEVTENLVAVCHTHHMDHEFAPRDRIPRGALPACVLDLADAEGLMHYIDATYPA